MKRLLILIAALALLALSLGSGKASPPGPDRGGTGSSINSPSKVGAPAATAYALVAWSELGMHCIDGKDYSIFSVLPPYNIIHAQLLKKGSRRWRLPVA